MGLTAYEAMVLMRTDPEAKPFERTHGTALTPEYRAWQTMRRRCYEPADQAYPDYGGRGITVCDRWLESPLNFIEDMGLKPTPKHELDREKNHLGYSKENCRWVTRSVNDQNRRSNRMITYQGETRPLVAWARSLGISETTVSKRLANGWTVDKALSTPTRGAFIQKFCAECGRRCYGARCQTCENKTRNKRK